MTTNLSPQHIKNNSNLINGYKSQEMEEADELNFIIKNKICKIINIQNELRQAIIAGKYKKSSTLMVLLEQAQVELEMFYLT